MGTGSLDFRNFEQRVRSSLALYTQQIECGPVSGSIVDCDATIDGFSVLVFNERAVNRTCVRVHVCLLFGEAVGDWRRLASLACRAAYRSGLSFWFSSSHLLRSPIYMTPCRRQVFDLSSSTVG